MSIPMMRRRLLMAMGMEDEEVKEWKISGEEYELSEDTTNWNFEMPNVSEIFVIFLPFGTTQNSAGGSGGINVYSGTKKVDFINVINNTISEKAEKVWRKKALHIVLDNGMIYMESSEDTGYWSFTDGRSVTANMYMPRAVDFEKITDLELDGYLKYIGAGSKVKIWAR